MDNALIDLISKLSSAALGASSAKQNANEQQSPTSTPNSSNEFNAQTNAKSPSGSFVKSTENEKSQILKSDANKNKKPSTDAIIGMIVKHNQASRRIAEKNSTKNLND